jgi:hypothetical protein
VSETGNNSEPGSPRHAWEHQPGRPQYGHPDQDAHTDEYTHANADEDVHQLSGAGRIAAQVAPGNIVVYDIVVTGVTPNLAVSRWSTICRQTRF